MRRQWLGVVVTAAVVVLVGAGPTFGLEAGKAVPPEIQAKLKKYDSKYYVVYSDLDAATTQEAILRVTARAEWYWEHTKQFSGKITAKCPLYLMSDHAMYVAAGAPPGSLGMAASNRMLINCTGEKQDQLWPTVGHEMFHQFVHWVVGDKVPVWINEGLADYYGYSCLWTGDGLTCGIMYKADKPIIYDERREWREWQKAKAFLPFKELLAMSPAEFNKYGRKAYVQAWAMLYYLQFSEEGGKGQKQIDAYLKATAAGASPVETFTKCVGDPDTVEKACVDWWAACPEDFDSRYRDEAAAATLASFLGRAWSQGQKFADWDGFLAAAKGGSLKKSEKQPLPDSILKDAIERVDKKVGTWALEVPEAKGPPKNLPKIILTRKDGEVLTATFVVKDGQVDSTKVEFKKKS
jgi:hypothetical protein